MTGPIDPTHIQPKLSDVIKATRAELRQIITLTRLGKPGLRQIAARSQALDDMFLQLEHHMDHIERIRAGQARANGATTPSADAANPPQVENA